MRAKSRRDGLGVYHATLEELQAIDEADRSGVATDAEVEAVLKSFRRV
jgi:hypothetical protein